MFGRVILSGGRGPSMWTRGLKLQHQRWASVLVLAEHDNKKLNPATHSLVTAGRKLGDVTVLVLGKDCAGVAGEASTVQDVSSVLHTDDDAYAHGSAENATLFLQGLVAAKGFSHVLFPNSALGKDIMPRLAVKLDTQPISDVMEIKDENTFVRPVYAGNALMTVKTTQALKIMSIRPTNFDKAGETGGSAKVESVAGAGEAPSGNIWVKDELSGGDRPELAGAGVVIGGGRGLASKENFGILEQLADNLGGAVGASRAAVDAGYAGNDLQVGQTGKVVAPDLYVAVGISGAIQHLAGMKDSKTIVAINKDEEAPIFQVADYGLKADLFKAVPEMTTATAKK